MVYPKLNSKDKCAFPKRIDCNGDASDCDFRCEYMKYDNSKSIFSPNRWRCIYKKPSKSELKQELPTKEESK